MGWRGAGGGGGGGAGGREGAERKSGLSFSASFSDLSDPHFHRLKKA